MLYEIPEPEGVVTVIVPEGTVHVGWDNVTTGVAIEITVTVIEVCDAHSPEEGVKV